MTDPKTAAMFVLLLNKTNVPALLDNKKPIRVVVDLGQGHKKVVWQFLLESEEEVRRAVEEGLVVHWTSTISITKSRNCGGYHIGYNALPFLRPESRLWFFSFEKALAQANNLCPITEQPADMDEYLGGFCW